MSIHHRIIHHVYRHKDNFIAHVNKHQKKYIFGVGIFSGRALTKLITLMVIFMGMSKIGGTTGADYYDAEFYNSRVGNTINISSLMQTGDNLQTKTGNLYTGINGAGL